MGDPYQAKMAFLADPMKALLGQNAKTPFFAATSRYYSVEIAAMQSEDGRTILYLRRRFVPKPERFVTIHEHMVSEGERPDTIAARYLGDSEQFWRLCDANRTMNPSELTKPERIGRRIRITLPEGITGVTYG